MTMAQQLKIKVLALQLKDLNVTCKDIIEIMALGHLWGNGTVTKVASCTENGIMIYSCENCSETKTESISKLAL